LVPISRGRTVADLARLLRLPCLIVARTRLGTLNHTLLTVESARRRGLRVVGVVLNPAEPADGKAGSRLAQRSNPGVLRDWLDVPVLGPLRRYPGRLEPRALARWIAAGLGDRALRGLERAVGLAGSARASMTAD